MVLKKLLPFALLLSVSFVGVHASTEPTELAVNAAADATNAAVNATKANDYLCGSLVVLIADGWKITQIEMKQGTIQNQFQFRKTDDENKFYKPNGLGDNLLHVRQSTGYTNISRVYLKNHAIDFVLTITQDAGINEVNYSVKKSVCNGYKVGEVEITQISGNEVPYHLQRPEQDDTTWKVHWLSSRFFTPAYLLIPAPTLDSDE